ncbi:MAG: DUF427 domain-containing protein [Rhodospirillaceae bacterium]|jgi:uncharacterized protein (DUF427 family)|nr:DUF427 domain-containing protein [Rhodospirillaceae bacterium]MBT4938035.1 DUF427 domain-containing protein [Rhodospirillaceae bacterium]MBT5941550.1 DUF427 domain-containing protein [Rhodospirillaceae bacterium]MBT7268134.1 DUF427 domain-containing protein [Rhodospirillaceae bacterium]
MAKAFWNETLIAESDDIALVEGNAYFPIESVNFKYLVKNISAPQTYCHWKGIANYYDIIVGGKTNESAAWRYFEPYDEAAIINDRIAFWKDVMVVGQPKGTGLIEQDPSPRAGRTGWEALCWLLRHSDQAVLSPSDIFDNTDIEENEIRRVWDIFDVQRYASRYKWHLSGAENEGGPLQIEKIND